MLLVETTKTFQFDLSNTIILNPKLTLSRNIFDLMSSMRFAVSMLSVLGIASIIGTVLKQNEPYSNYIIKFGQFWFGFFEALGLYDVYHSGWFLLILLFLITSCSLCIYRNSPLMVQEWRTFKEQATEKSLNAFIHQETYIVSALENQNLANTKQ